MLCRLAVRTGRLPSEWAGEDARAIFTVLALLEEQDQADRHRDSEGGQ